MKGLFSRWKSSRSLKEYYGEWINRLKSSLLPLLSRSLSSSSHPPDLLLLSTHVDLLHSHFSAYFTALDSACTTTTTTDVSQLLFPDWRNSLEKPFLWLGDFHPYIFTHLLRSFLQDHPDDGDGDGDGDVNDTHASQFQGNTISWKRFDSSIWHKVEKLERGLRLMVPSIAARHRDAQAAIVAKLALGWTTDRADLKVRELMGEAVDELTAVFLDANRLRRSLLGDIMALLSVHQAAFFLERLAQFYVGFWDAKLLADFKKSHLPLD